MSYKGESLESRLWVEAHAQGVMLRGGGLCKRYKGSEVLKFDKEEVDARRPPSNRRRKRQLADSGKTKETGQRLRDRLKNTLKPMK